MNPFELVAKAWKHPDKILTNLGRRGFLNWMSDEQYLKLMYRCVFKKKLDLDNPQTFNEKLQWLKLHDRNPLYTTLVDKYEVKQWVADRIGEEHIIPTLGVWDRFDDIDFDLLPEQFVLKCTHDSGGIVICKDKSKLDKTAAKKKIEKSLKQNFYWFGREWPYKNVKPRIIAEKYMVDKTECDLKDYKFFCFGGVCKCMKVDFDRFIEHHANYYDPQRNLLDLGETICPPDKQKEIVLPDSMDKMIAFAEKLSHATPFLRADFYDTDGITYFGELTFYPASGFGTFTDNEWDQLLGEWIKLPEKFGGGNLIKAGNWILWIHEQKKSVPITERNTESLTDYKFYCFDGKPQFLYVSSGLENHATARISFLTMDWQFAPFGRCDYVPFEKLPQKPARYNEMTEIARKLAEKKRFARIDMYQINGAVYFSEITFSPCSGMMPFVPEKWDLRLGDMLDLEK